MSVMIRSISVVHGGISMTNTLTAEAHNASMQDYVRVGTESALTLGNRGPIRFDANGKLAADILDAYWRHGFYVFEGVLSERTQEEKSMPGGAPPGRIFPEGRVE